MDAEGRVWLLCGWQYPPCGLHPMEVVGWRGGRFHRYGAEIESDIVRCSSFRLLFLHPFVKPDSPREIYGGPEKYFTAHDEKGKVENCALIIGDLRTRVDGSLQTLLDIGSGRGEMLAAAVNGAWGLWGWDSHEP